MSSDVASQVWQLAARPEAVAQGRNALAEYARAAGAEADMIEDIRVAVSEAVTNAVLHGFVGREPGTISIHARQVDGQLEISVSDDGSGPDPVRESPGLGVGLPLIASLTESFTIASSAERGTTLEMCFRLRPDRAAPRFTVTARQEGGRVVITAQGEIDIATVSCLETLLHEHVRHDIVVDLAGVTFLDTSALRVFVAQQRAAEAGGPRFALAGANPRVVRLLEIAGLTSRLELLDPGGRDDDPAAR